VVNAETVQRLPCFIMAGSVVLAFAAALIAEGDGG
jgi:hypothetical protein